MLGLAHTRPGQDLVGDRLGPVSSKANPGGQGLSSRQEMVKPKGSAKKGKGVWIGGASLGLRSSCLFGGRKREASLVLKDDAPKSKITYIHPLSSGGSAPLEIPYVAGGEDSLSLAFWVKNACKKREASGLSKKDKGVAREKQCVGSTVG